MIKETKESTYLLTWENAKPDCVLDYQGNFVSGTDNTKQITDAIMKTPKNGVLILPPGMFLFNYIEVVRNDITIQGNNTFLVSSVKPEQDKHAIWINGDNITLKNLSVFYDRPFDYDTTYKPTAFGNSNTIRLGGDRPTKPNGGWREGIRVSNVRINGGYSGGLDFYFANDVKIDDISIYNTLGNGLNFANCQRDITGEGITIKNTRDDGIQCTCDVNVPDGTKNYRLDGLTVVNSYAKGISTTGVNGGSIQNFYVENTWGGGLQPFNDAYYNLGKSVNVTCKNGTIVNAGKNFGPGKYKTTKSDNADGIYLSQDTSDVLFENIKIYDSARHGVTAINGAKNIKFKEVIVRRAVGRGFAIGNTEDTAVLSGKNISLESCEVEDVGEYAVSFGGVDLGSIKDCKFTEWGNTNYPVLIRNCNNIDSKDNTIIFKTKGLVTSLIRTELSRNIVDNGNRLINTQTVTDIPKNSVLIGTNRVSFNAGVPTSYVWNEDDITFDTNATAGGKVGFWCRRSGRAAVQWTANKTVAIGDYIVPTSDNGHAFRCTKAGVAGATQPTWITTSGGVTVDNTAEWTEVGVSALFKPFGAIDA